MTRSQRAVQIWALLVCAARERRTYTYGGMADMLGFGGAQVLGSLLAPIMRLCRARGWPPLTILVVNQSTGRPGDGLPLDDSVDVERERVFNFDWFSLEPPETEDFDEVLE